jgi:hypothetical protein
MAKNLQFRFLDPLGEPVMSFDRTLCERSVVQRRLTGTAVALMLSLLCLCSVGAWAVPITSSQSLISKSVPMESNGTTGSSVSDGQNSAASFLVPGTSTMGAAVSSDGSAFSVSTSTSHTDDWSCPTCPPSTSVLPLTVTIGFDADFSAHIGEFSLVAQYLTEVGTFRLSVSEDSGPVVATANWGVDPVDVVLTTDPSTGMTHVSTSFVGSLMMPTSCNGTQGPCGFFSDSQGISLEMEGSGFVDASHTFSVGLAPNDPNILLTSADGRTAGNATSAAPVPEPSSFLLVGTGLAAGAFARRFRRRQPAPFGAKW